MIEKFVKVEDYRWLKRYLRFIEVFKVDNIYKNNTHKHHILPKSLYSEYSNLSLNKWNLAILGYREHLIAHYMLAKALQGNMWYAYNNMNAYKVRLSSRLYESAQREVSIQQSIRMIQWLRKNEHPRGMLGKKHSKESKLLNKLKSSGTNNPNFKKKKIIIMDAEGLIKKSIYRFQIRELSNQYPKRMIDWCLGNKKPMYLSNLPKDNSHKKFIGWYACYEDEIWSRIDVRIRDNSKKEPVEKFVYYIYNNLGELSAKIKNKDLRKYCRENNMKLNQFQYSYRQSGKKIKNGIHAEWYCIKIKEKDENFSNE